jgi:uncharacterized protein with HEPN domain
MKDNDFQRIKRIQGYCKDIDDTIIRFGNDFAIFSKDTDYQNSISMSIMQIGELSNGLSEEFKDKTREHVQWGPIKAMRNMFAHGYASMDIEVIWETATKDIPVLSKFCLAVLAKERTARDKDSR